MNKVIVLAGIIVATASCGGSSPSAPSTPPAVAPSITTQGDTIYIGTVVQFAASGSSPITWGGDNPNVATVDQANGRVTGVGNGRVTVWAENTGGRTTRLLRGMPSYAGEWSGTYAITGCQSTGDFARGGFCGSFSQGQVAQIRFSMTQNVDRVSGAFALGGINGSLTPGTVSEDGSMAISGTHSEAGDLILLENLRATSPSAGTIQGRFDQSWSLSGLSGTGRLSCEIRSVTRTSGGLTIFARPEGQPRDLKALIHAVLGR